MSGFVVVANLDGAPIDPVLMRRMTDALVFRGPDSNQIWMGQAIGLGHALFHTGGRPLTVEEPCSIDGEIWIAGDIRVDAREELIRALRAERGNRVKDATDPELVLHAYQAWGEACLDRLIGDFTFAIWDGPKKRLLCGRDQFGVKPLYYAQVGKQLLVSNTLSCIQAHHLISDELDEDAIGDFLLFGSNWNPATTTFAAIKRLPPAHILLWSLGGDPRVRGYWTLPFWNELRLKRPGEYLERFKSLMRIAVADRLPAGNVGVQMSGGLDSPTIASTARSLMTEAGSKFELRAHTIVYDSLIRDEERHYAGLVASHLGIPIEYLPADNYPLFGGNELGVNYPEPVEAHAQPILAHAFNRQMAARGRVTLTGFDGDGVLRAHLPSHFATLWRSSRFGSLSADAFRFWRAKVDLLGMLSHRLRWPRRGGTGVSAYPTWLNPDFEQRQGIKARWTNMPRGPHEEEFPRQSAFAAMGHPSWLSLLEIFDAGTTGVPLERRHPLLDLRLVKFLLSLPAVPWCVNKHIFRASMHDMLPREVLRRPKTPMATDPWASLLARHKDDLRNFEFHPAVAQFVDENRYRDIIDQLGSEAYWLPLRVITLSGWLNARKAQQR